MFKMIDDEQLLSMVLFIAWPECNKSVLPIAA
jgi:hypothetical protein